jgi:PKD repeat protein
LSNTGLTGTVYFRIYGYAATSATGTWRLDNLNVQGSVTSGGATTGTGWFIDSVSVSQTVCCVTAPPVASFSGTPTIGTEPLMVSLSDTSTGTITDRFWVFGDGTQINVATNAVSHTYTAGVYSVTLIVSNAGGSSTNTKASYITVLTPFQSWQNHYWSGGASDPNAAPGLDPYGKGISNTNQFLAGFNPTNTAAYPHIMNIIVTTNKNVTVTYLGANGDNSYSGGPASRTNVLEYTGGTANGSYMNNFASTGQTNVLSGGNGSGIVTNMTDNGGATNVPSRYYRVRVLVP